MAASTELVVDASIALKWLFDDEDHLDLARQILAKAHKDELRFVVPPHWRLEVLNAIRSAILKGRIDEDEARKHAARFLKIKAATCDLDELGADVFRIVLDHQRTAYDAAYLALAERNGLEFVIGDKSLYQAVSRAMPFVTYLPDYQSPQDDPTDA